MRIYLQKYWCLFVVILTAQFLPVTVTQATEPVLEDGQTVTVLGKVFIARGEDIHERKVTYPAIRLDAPVTIADEIQSVANVNVLMLSPSRQKRLRSLHGKRVQIKGKVLYRWHGISAAPNSTMLVVQEVTVIHE